MDNPTEEYIIRNADLFNWGPFECDMSIYSKEFAEDFKSEIKKLVWLNSEGDYHREDGPALICKGLKNKVEWYINGKLHRTDGPAIIWNDYEGWHLNGEYHREDGPARTCSDGTKEWWINGKQHREDGPAIEEPDGTKNWWLNNKEYSEEEFNNKISEL